ncbi:6417_t:CDS:2 [Cetraspora pellucida]|uniref:6417_t:CDS:1 n=1 Tax=Cetraspora pellucida TaxID=1433469 RepID=A0ACA9KF45_9GLOM|nr:6417_t:CDS:2 [Cetraspora pellucida]
MLCHADTIVRVKYVKQYEKEDTNLLVVWALGAYPVEREDYYIKMTLFVPINPEDRDYETQAVFEKDHFFSVSGKIVPGYYGRNKRAKMTVSTCTHLVILNKVIESNKCSLKVSLVRVPQKMPNEIKDYAIFKTLVTDYSGQEQNFIMNVVFSCNSRLMHLKDTIRALESLIFVVGQLEIIDNEFYVYAKDVSYVDTRFVSKKKSFDSNASQDSSISKNSIRSKLLVTHQNIVESSKKKSVNETSNSSNCFLNEFVSSSRDYPSAAKCLRTGSLSGSSDEGLGNVEYIDHGSCTEASVKKVGEFTKSSKNKKTVSRGKGKQCVNRSLHSNSGLRECNSVNNKEAKI